MATKKAVKKQPKRKATKKVKPMPMVDSPIKLAKTVHNLSAAQDALFARGFRCVFIDPRTKVENWSKDGVSFHIGPNDVSIQTDILPYEKLTGEFEYMLFQR